MDMQMEMEMSCSNWMYGYGAQERSVSRQQRFGSHQYWRLWESSCKSDDHQLIYILEIQTFTDEFCFNQSYKLCISLSPRMCDSQLFFTLKYQATYSK